MNLPSRAAADLHSFLTRTRWFGGKGRKFTVTSVTELAEVPGRIETSPYVVIWLVEVSYSGSDDRQVYQVPLALYDAAEHRLDHASIGVWRLDGREVHVYDALHDREAMACYLRSFAVAGKSASTGRAGRPLAAERVETDASGSALVFHRLPGHDLDLEAHSTLFAGEQSNSSAAFGEDSLLKVFRQVTPGVNPDILIHKALTEAGSEHVAPLYGWLEANVPVVEPVETAEPLHLAMLQGFLRTATDGWELGLSSVRTLFAEPEHHASESGGDFAGEAARLGEALAEVHATLADRFGVEQRAAAATAEAMTVRLDRAAAELPQLRAYEPRLRALIDAVRASDRLEVQTIHGDLHLGQTLRTSLGWKIVDFEGEPARPVAERHQPDSPWRDIACMLRSFDYAPGAVIAGLDRDEEEPDDRDQLLARAGEWTARASRYFLESYAGPLTPEEQTLLDAYVADKAVYECVYEARNRPTWLDIPLTAVARLAG